MATRKSGNPGEYVQNGSGYSYVPGYWDYPLEDRGLLYPPVYFSEPLWQNPDWAYRPGWPFGLGYAAGEPADSWPPVHRTGFNTYCYAATLQPVGAGVGRIWLGARNWLRLGSGIGAGAATTRGGEAAAATRTALESLTATRTGIRTGLRTCHRRYVHMRSARGLPAARRYRRSETWQASRPWRRTSARVKLRHARPRSPTLLKHLIQLASQVANQCKHASDTRDLNSSRTQPRRCEMRTARIAPARTSP